MRVSHDEVRAYSARGEDRQHLITERIATHGRDDLRLHTQTVQMVGDIERRTAGRAAGGQAIPEHFAKTKHTRRLGNAHSVRQDLRLRHTSRQPRFLIISSRTAARITTPSTTFWV